MLDALRTPYGRRGGALSTWHPVDLAAELLSQLVGRHGLDGSLVEDVVLGCTSQVGAQAGNIAVSYTHLHVRLPGGSGPSSGAP